MKLFCDQKCKILINCLRASNFLKIGQYSSVVDVLVECPGFKPRSILSWQLRHLITVFYPYKTNCFRYIESIYVTEIKCVTVDGFNINTCWNPWRLISIYTKLPDQVITTQTIYTIKSELLAMERTLCSLLDQMINVKYIQRICLYEYIKWMMWRWKLCANIGW